MSVEKKHGDAKKKGSGHKDALSRYVLCCLHPSMACFAVLLPFCFLPALVTKFLAGSMV